MGMVGNIKDYEYQETVFVFGDLMKYVKGLESYFRDSAEDYYSGGLHQKRGIERLVEAHEIHKKHNPGLFEYIGGRYNFPFPINEENYEQGLELLKNRLEGIKKIEKVQRINQEKLSRILQGQQSLDFLDLTNYAYDNHVVRITPATVLGPHNFPAESIRMRVFFNIASDEFYQGIAKGFAQHANRIEAVKAECSKESKVDEKIPSLDALAAAKVPRSELRVKKHDFNVEKKGNKIIYSTQLSKAYIEMLQLISINVVCPESLYFGSYTWSPSQGQKILRNLFGIVAINEKTRSRGHRYMGFFVPEENSEAVNQAIKNKGVFCKSIDMQSMPVLAYVHQRTTELKNQFGAGFYPQFCATEVAKKTGIDKEKVHSHLEDLTGILAKVDVSYTIYHGESGYHIITPRWIIPRSRTTLVNQILQS